MLQINGALGEGGGQILRTALSLAMITGQAIRIENIRAGREKPGLMRQHLACVNAARDICDAEVTGNHIGSTEISFKPGTIKAGHYQFSVGSAGSTLLIFQTVLPALMLADQPSELQFYGGTHNMLAPSFDFIAHSFAPLLRRMGVGLEMQLTQHGFYPQGGGSWQVTITPTSHLQTLELDQAGELITPHAVISSANIPEHVAVRERDELLRLTGWQASQIQLQQVNCLGSGNILSLRLQYQHHTEMTEVVGRIGLSAEKVVRSAFKQMHRYQQSGAAVGEHLADQLLLPMALSQGGCFSTLPPSLHCDTNRQIIERFLPCRFKFEAQTPGNWLITIN